MIEEDFHLLASAALDGVLPRAKINFGAHPQGVTWPGVVINVIDNADDPHMAGTDGLWRGRLQVDCYALTYLAARDISAALIEALNGHSDEAFQGIFLIARRDGRDTSTTDKPFRMSLDFSTTWSERHG